MCFRRTVTDVCECCFGSSALATLCLAGGGGREQATRRDNPRWAGDDRVGSLKFSSNWIKGFRSRLRQHADLIPLDGVPPSLMPLLSALARARSGAVDTGGVVLPHDAVDAHARQLLPHGHAEEEDELSMFAMPDDQGL